MTVSATLQDVLLTDVDGDTRFDPGDTIQYTAVISNTGDADATGVSFADLLDAQTTLGTVKVSPLASRDMFNAVGNTRLVVPAGSGLRANDIDIDGLTPQASLVVTAGTFATSQGGSVAVAADGSFTYDPQLGDQFVTDTFTYTITDADGLASTGTVTINLGQRVWYVDPTGAAGGNGSLISPFNLIATVSGASGPDNTGDILYVHERSGDVNGNLTLLANQSLLGSGVALTVNSVNVLPASSNTTWTTTAAATDAITLSGTNTVRGISIGNTTGTGLVGGLVGALTINSVSKTGTGKIIDISGTAANNVSITLDTASSTSSSTEAMEFNSLSGTVTVTAGAISGAAASDIAIIGGNANFTFGNSVTNTANRSLDVQIRTGGTVSFNGPINDTGAGIFMQGNTGGTINFTNASKVLNTGVNAAVTLQSNTGTTINFTGGGLDIDTTTGVGFNATGGGTFSVTGTGNTIDATSGTGLNINATTISGSGATFQRISSGAGANNGINLVSSGAGPFTITGLDGADAGTNPDLGSGGIINGKTDADGSATAGSGVFLSSANNVSLNGMSINNHQNYGVRGVQVDGFRLTFSLVGGANGTNVASPFSEGSVSFIGTATTGYGLRGAVAILDNEITGGFQRNVSIDNATGTMNLNFLRNNVHHTHENLATPGSSQGDDGVAIEVDTSAVMFANVSNNTFTAHGGDHFNLSLVNSANADLTFKNNDMQGGHVLGLGQGVFVLGASYNGTFKYDISNNGTVADPFVGNKQGAAIFVNKGSGTGTFSGQITNNVIGNPAVAGSGSAQAQGIHASARGAGGSHKTLISGNLVRQFFDRGIVLEAGEGAPSFTASVIGNTVSNFADAINSLHGIHCDFGILSADNAQITIDIRNNLVANAGNEPQGGVDIRMRTAASNDVFIGGYTGGNSAAAVQAYLDAQNPDGTTFSVSLVTSGAPPATYNNGPAVPFSAPNLPALPPAPLLASVAAADPAYSTLPIKTPSAADDVDSAPAVSSQSSVGPGSNDRALTRADIDLQIAAALARWSSSGLTPAQRVALDAITFDIADLPGWYLGEAGDGVVTLDTDGAGNGWFVDPTPLTDGDVPAGKLDLLTAIMHEMGHQLGLDDSYQLADRDSVMYGYLALGERRLPAVGQAVGVEPHAHDDHGGPDFLFTPINIGTLTFGTTVRVRFTATIANPLVGAGSVSNQGSVSGSNFAAVNTDDPDVAGTQATVTAVQPATPAVPDLQAASDSGSSTTDNLTKVFTPVFNASGVDAAAIVELLRNGGVIASRTGPGALTDPSVPIGTFTYSLRQRFGAGGANSDSSPSLTVIIDRTPPATPAAPDMTAASDTGSLNNDNITKDNTPDFDFSGVETGALVELLDGTTVVGSRTGPGILTATSPLSDGGHALKARITDAAGNVNTDSLAPVLNIVVDTIAPTLTGTPVFQYETGLSILYSFSELLTNTFTSASVVVSNLTTPGTVANANKSVSFLGTDVRLSFAGLTDADYRAVIAAGSLSDLAGNAMAAASAVDFFVLAGDFNRDRRVNFDDLVVLAQNYNESPRVFSQGDATYDGTVNFDDLVVLSQRYGSSLAVVAEPAKPAVISKPRRSSGFRPSDLLENADGQR